jgi:Mn2+/Fe2+ NRAMP family transporter
LGARKLWNSLGPGILLAAASVGASHLVLSPQAGSRFGFELLWLVVVAHLVKYPAFEFGPRYAAATGCHLLDGYARIPGPGRWAVIVFLVGTLVQGIGVLSAVMGVAGSVLSTWTGWLGMEWFSTILAAVIVGLLFAGGFSWLDHLNKIMMAGLALATLLAFVPILPGPETLSHLVVPSVPAGSLVLVAAILSWMPTGIDVSVWHSFWTLEKLRARSAGAADESKTARVEYLRTSLWDMRAGYLLSLLTGLMFMTMGAVHLAGRGKELQDIEFAEALSTAYTAILGPWMYHVFMLTAFFAMFSTSYTVVDGFSRSFSECCAVLSPRASGVRTRKRVYHGFVIASALLASVILVLVGNPVTLVKAAALLSLATAPLLYAFNLYCVTHHIDEPQWRPSAASVCLACIGVVLMFVALVAMAYFELPRILNPAG